MGFSQVKLSKQMRPLRFRSNCVISLLLVPWSAKINQGPGFCKLWSLQQFSFLYPKAGDPHNFAKNGLTDLCKGLKRLKWNLLMGSWVFPSSYSLWSRFPWCSKFHIFGCHGPARKPCDPHNFAKNGHTDLCKSLKCLKLNILMGS